MTSDSRSAIAFPDEGVGMNLGLRPLCRGPDRPPIDRARPPCLLDPRPRYRLIFDAEEVRLGNPHIHSALNVRATCLEEEPTPDRWKMPLHQPQQARVEAQHAETALKARERAMQRGGPTAEIMINLHLQQQGDSGPDELEQAFQR